MIYSIQELQIRLEVGRDIGNIAQLVYYPQLTTIRAAFKVVRTKKER